ncbi:type I glyceraldehyde-3-phosphate dehydrogenase, partial [Vibrio splendidus]
MTLNKLSRIIYCRCILDSVILLPVIFNQKLSCGATTMTIKVGINGF